MRWDDFRRSDNVEDRSRRRRWRIRRRRRFRHSDGGGGGLGIGTVMVLGLIGWALGIDPRILIGGAEIVSGGGSQQQQQPSQRRAASRRRADRPDGKVRRRRSRRHRGYAGSEIFAAERQALSPAAARAVLAARCAAACGMAQSAMGPFYCPSDQRVYLDTSFFRDMRTRFQRLQRQRAASSPRPT